MLILTIIHAIHSLFGTSFGDLKNAKNCFSSEIPTKVKLDKVSLDTV